MPQNPLLDDLDDLEFADFDTKNPWTFQQGSGQDHV